MLRISQVQLYLTIRTLILRMISTNLIGSINVINACINNNVKKLIYLSSGGTVYGDPISVPIDESHPTNPSCSYGINKLATEKYLSLFNKLHELNYIILRLANPYGDRQRLDTGQGVVPAFLRKAIRSEPIQVWGTELLSEIFIYIRCYTSNNNVMPIQWSRKTF